MCLVQQVILPIQVICFSQYEKVAFKLLFIINDYSLFLEDQEDSEDREDHIYIKHLEGILQSIPLEKDLDHLLAS